MTTRWFVAFAASLLALPLSAAAEPAEDRAHVIARVAELSRGEGSLDGFRIEIVEQGEFIGRRDYRIGGGKIAMEVRTGSDEPSARSERAVSDADVRKLLQELIAQKYWTIGSAAWITDAPVFQFRLWDGERYVAFECNYSGNSPQWKAAHSLLKNFVTAHLPD